MLANGATTGFDMFGDEVVTSTDLNRRTGTILDRVREKPVTISRNSEQFALLRREDAANLVKGRSQTQAVMDLFEAVLDVMRGTAPSNTALAWVKVFDKGDRQKMLQEVAAETRAALKGEAAWESVASLIHEWAESAAVIGSGVLVAARGEESNEQELTHPDSVAVEPES